MEGQSIFLVEKSPNFFNEIMINFLVKQNDSSKKKWKNHKIDILLFLKDFQIKIEVKKK